MVMDEFGNVWSKGAGEWGMADWIKCEPVKNKVRCEITSDLYDEVLLKEVDSVNLYGVYGRLSPYKISFDGINTPILAFSFERDGNVLNIFKEDV